MELSDRYPEFFPKDIVVPSEQLQKIADVAEGMKYRQIPLAETVDDGMKAGMRDEFERAMDDLQIETAKLTRYTNERAEKQMKKLPPGRNVNADEALYDALCKKYGKDNIKIAWNVKKD